MQKRTAAGNCGGFVVFGRRSNRFAGFYNSDTTPIQVDYNFDAFCTNLDRIIDVEQTRNGGYAMRRWLLALAALMLLAACKAAPTETPDANDGKRAQKPVSTEQTEDTPLPVRTQQTSETPMPTETPAPTDTPAPTPDGLLGGRFADKFSDVPELAERSYRSRSVGVEVTEYTDDERYGRHVVYYVADIYVQDVTSIRAEAAQGDFGMRYSRFVKEIADDAGALLAIDGDTYTHAAKSFVIRNGVLYRKTLIDNTDLCVLYRDGRMETKKWGTFTMQEIIDSDPWQVWGFGPALLDADGKSTEIRHALAGPNPRTAIGYYEPGHYCFVVVDGRGKSEGITLNALSRLMEDLGCTVAYNLDGGASAQMYWNGEIISKPCSKDRVISDIIYLLPEE